MNYQTIKLDKAMYKTGEGFTARLEELDPSPAYRGTPLEGLDAYQRQLKRFDIRVGGARSSPVQKFFATSDSAALFPEYVSRAVRQGMEQEKILSAILASRTAIDSMDYRTISLEEAGQALDPMEVAEGAVIPRTDLKLKEGLVRLKKRGRMLCASYEALRFQRLDLFTVALRQIGSRIARSQLEDAVEVLLLGDGSAAASASAETAGAALAYTDLVALWQRFDGYRMDTLLAAPDMAAAILDLPEMSSPSAGLNFQATGKLGTPLGATLLKSSAVPAGTVIALDSGCALEMAVAQEVSVDYDKLIDCQLERASITSIAGFARLFPQAVQVLTLRKGD
ncbi:MAG: phage major capsid protein [Angelakisella sp.]|jgi:hypothetical protein|nr:phage major capsid protein [Angelakisella sp.]